MGAAWRPEDGGARVGRASLGERALAVVARPLHRGRVKTRLASHIGADGALRAHARLLIWKKPCQEGVVDPPLPFAEEGQTMATAG
jgi:hypothetical protein